uniref:Uncharacterized protein n=1 Tax=Romanomermis culicivorax TaxID=13658 RepID=A0A915J5E5_ROMCU
ESNLVNREAENQVNRTESEYILTSTNLPTAQTTISATSSFDVSTNEATVNHANGRNSYPAETNSDSSFVQNKIRASISFPITHEFDKSGAIPNLFHETNSTSAKKNLSLNITETAVNALESSTTTLAFNKSETTVEFEDDSITDAKTESNLLTNPIGELKLFTKNHDWPNKGNNKATALPLHENATIKSERKDLILSTKFGAKPRKLIDVCGNVTEIVRKLVRDTQIRVGVNSYTNFTKRSTTFFSSTARTSAPSIDSSSSKTRVGYESVKILSELKLRSKTVDTIQTVSPLMIVANRKLTNSSTHGKSVGFRNDGINDDQTFLGYSSCALDDLATDFFMIHDSSTTYKQNGIRYCI